MIAINNRNSHNPYINLAIEEYVVRQTVLKDQDYVLLYINEPAVVVGKNQSIYKEVNFDTLRTKEIKPCRRISGGGTVYQDFGNLNFCFIQPFAEHKINNYRWFNQPLVDALNKVGILAETDERNNIIVGGKKISGNAQFTDRKKIISHGTLLFNADLTKLRKSLSENEFRVESKSVGSVRSSVANIADISTHYASIDELKNYLIQSLGVEEELIFSDEQWLEIIDLAKSKFASPAWIYGRSPKTIIHKDWGNLIIEEGIIAALENSNEKCPNFVGVPYNYEGIKKALEQYPSASEWLKKLF